MHQTTAPRAVDMRHLVDHFDALFFDAYGVLVEHGGALPGAPELVAALNREGVNYFIVTNDASRLTETAVRRFEGLGLPISGERIVSSGDLIGPYFERNGLHGATCAVLGTQDSREYVRRAGGVIVPPSEDMDLVVVSDDDDYPFLETVNAVISALFLRVERGLTTRLLLPNPDLLYPRGRGVGLASGSVALLIESALALRFPQRPELRFDRLGKPFAPIFEEACRRAGTRSAVMVGDQLETDIRGARDFGLQSALVLTGITHPDEAVRGEVRPTYLLQSLDLSR